MALRFGTPTILVGFEKVLTSFCDDFDFSTEDDVNADIMNILSGFAFDVGGTTMVRLGDCLIELAPQWRRYVVVNSAELHLHPIVARVIEPVILSGPRCTFQVEIESEARGTLDVHVLDMAGSEVALISVDPDSTRVMDLFDQVAQAVMLHISALDLILSNGRCLSDEDSQTLFKDALTVAVQA
eukprot:TRINITY_DN68863_c0_g1_i1.p1 TRINITY_DN68863_c0_g1~~TRINITY_DN68863_c0_g1_i1.p1  ORF type:complete len:202 (+),score=12.17 TRINITY_DN68863_c0_g1_i1:56-607(+)